MKGSAEGSIWDTLAGLVVISYQHSYHIYMVRIRCHGAAAAHGELTGAEHVVIRLCIIDGWLVVSSWGWLINVNKKILPTMDIR